MGLYALFPLLLVAVASALLGAWLVQDAGLRRTPALPGWFLIGVLPLVLLGLLARGAGAAGSGVAVALLLGGAAPLLGLAGAAAALPRLRRPWTIPDSPRRPGLLGPRVLLPVLGAIAACYLLSLLLALSAGTLAF